MLRFYISVQAVELGAVTLAGVSAFVEAHVWSPAYTYYLLLVLVVLDVLTNNLLNKKPLRPRVLALRLAGYTVVLALAHGFAAHEPGLVWLAQLVLAPFVIVHLRRLIIAFGKLELVDGDVAELLSRRITARAERAAEAEAEAEALPTPDATPAAVASPEPLAAVS
jgi:hypothetical protein